jgi:hypothetical protein
MCLSGDIDAIYKKYNGTKYILRGRHYYSLDNPSERGESFKNWAFDYVFNKNLI